LPPRRTTWRRAGRGARAPAAAPFPRRRAAC